MKSEQFFCFVLSTPSIEALFFVHLLPTALPFNWLGVWQRVESVR